MLKALDFAKDTTIYIAAGTIYGGESRMAALRDVFPNTVSLYYITEIYCKSD